MPSACFKSRLPPPESAAPWEKGHWRLDHRALVRTAVTPEQIGLCGCGQVIGVYRKRIGLSPDKPEPSECIAYYVTSLYEDEYSDDQLLEAIRGHWSAIENGVHYRRDVSFGEDACRVAHRRSSHILASLRNLAIGLFELQSARKATRAKGCKSWCRRMTFSAARGLLA